MPQVPLPSKALSSQPSGQFDDRAQVIPVQHEGFNQIQQAAAAMTKAGQDVQAIEMQMNEDHALATSKAGMNEWAEYEKSQTDTYRQQLGRNAFVMDGKETLPGEAPSKIAEQTEARARSIEEGMTSGLAKRMFRETVDANMVRHKSSLFQHEAEQLKIFGHGQRVASMERHATAWIDKGDRADYASAVRHAEDIATEEGYSDEETDAFLLKLETGMNVGTIKGYLENDDALGARAFLKKLRPDQIAASERERLHASLDLKIEAEAAVKGADDLIKRFGHKAKMPEPEEQKKIVTTAVLEVAEQSGASKEQLEVLKQQIANAESPSDYAHLLTDPRVMARVDSRFSLNDLTIDESVRVSRQHDKTSPLDPTEGPLARMLSEIRQRHIKGDYTAEQAKERSVALMEQTKKAYDEINASDRVTLEQTKSILDQYEKNGVTVFPSSPQFKKDYPTVFEKLRERGLLKSATLFARGAEDRITDPRFYDRMLADHQTGAMARMSYDELVVKYESRMSPNAWKETIRRWSSHHSGAAIEGKVVNDSMAKWDRPTRFYFGDEGGWETKDKDGVPMPDSDEEKEEWNAFQDALREELKTSGDMNPDQVREFAKQWQTRTIGIEKRSGFGGYYYDAKSAAYLDQQILTAQRNGNEPEAERLQLIKNSGAVNLSGDPKNPTWVKVKARVIQGTMLRPISARAGDYLVDMHRLSELKRVTPPAEFDGLLKRLEAAGIEGNTPHRDNTVIQSIFHNAGLSREWPTPAEQWERWDADGVREMWEGKHGREPSPIQSGRWPTGGRATPSDDSRWQGGRGGMDDSRWQGGR